MSQDTSTDSARQGHLCLGCGCRIAAGMPEIKVELRGRFRGRVRYRHADDSGCAAALRSPQPNVALIGRYEALPTFAWSASPAEAAPEQDS